jgi:hypothetical protein
MRSSAASRVRGDPGARSQPARAPHRQAPRGSGSGWVARADHTPDSLRGEVGQPAQDVGGRSGSTGGGWVRFNRCRHQAPRARGGAACAVLRRSIDPRVAQQRGQSPSARPPRPQWARGVAGCLVGDWCVDHRADSANYSVTIPQYACGRACLDRSVLCGEAVRAGIASRSPPGRLARPAQRAAAPTGLFGLPSDWWVAVVSVSRSFGEEPSRRLPRFHRTKRPGPTSALPRPIAASAAVGGAARRTPAGPISRTDCPGQSSVVSPHRRAASTWTPRWSPGSTVTLT